MDNRNLADTFARLGVSLSVIPSARVGSYRGGGDFCFALSPVTAADFQTVYRAHQQDIPLLNAGACTNLLVPDNGYHGLSVHTDRLRGVWIDSDRLIAGAGERLPLLAARAADANLGGMEALHGIPGTLGGAVAMNAGAYGTEIASLLDSVTCFDWTIGRFITVNADTIPFDYRTDGGYFDKKTIVAATLRLYPDKTEDVRVKMRAFAQKRAASQPHDPSLGSTFRRSADVSAGYYIDRAGLKGVRIGGAAVSTVHAGFLVNTGGGTAEDYIKLSELVARTVWARFGIRLEREFRVAQT